MTLSTIYKTTKTNAVVYCKISTALNIITVETGQVNTDKPTLHTTTCSPKNVGRSNETSGTTQAELEAVSKHTKKIKSGYTLDESGEISITLPEKVKVYQDQLNNITFPCYVTDKLNGVNGTYTKNSDNGKYDLTSRGGEDFPRIPHLERSIDKAMFILHTNTLNGELYIPGTHLEDIQSAVKKPKDLSNQLEFHVFDIPGWDVEYKDKVKTLELFEDLMGVKMIKPSIANNHEDIENLYLDAMSRGMEGVVIKNANHKYHYNERNSNAFKYKIAQDAEFQTFKYELDKHNHPVFHCNTKNNDRTFKVKLKGTAESRLAMAAIADSYIGKWLKVEFETYSKYGVPQKPVGLLFRKCDSNGNPLE